MAATATAVAPRRGLAKHQIVAIIGVLIAALMVWLVSRDLAPGGISTLRITYPGAKASEPALLSLPLPTIWTIAAISLLLVGGAARLWLRPSANAISVYIGLLIFAVIFDILIWANNGSRTDIIDLLARTIRLATPIALGALAGILCERSGVTNIAIEGLMLTGACVGFIAALLFSSSWIGVLAAILAGGAIVMVHALLAIHYKTDQIISGTVINILAVGVTGFLRQSVILPLQAKGTTTASLPEIPIPGLSQIPVIGPLLFTHKPITYAMLLLVVFVHVMLFYTPWGLRTRAVGEHPRAADTMGINVIRLRYLNVWCAGLVAGLAGAWFSLEASFNFDDLMTNGKGFIGLAAMIFGKWTPFGSLAGALIFTSADALQIRLQGLDFALPSQFIQMLPYVITIIVLAGVVGRARPPAALGKPYEK